MSKKLLAVICALALTATIGLTALAVFAEDTTTTPGASNVATDDQSTAAPDATTAPANTDESTNDFPCKKFGKLLTDEEKAAMEAKREEMKAKIEAQQDKWNSLTDAQKAEIYALKDQKAALEGKITDKYLEFGVIDEATANEMKERITERSKEMKESGRMPGLGFGKGGRGGKGCRGLGK
jgi:hypothetical protein